MDARNISISMTKFQIGVGMVCETNNPISQIALQELKRFLPSNAVLVNIDNGITNGEIQATYRYDRTVPLAQAKNKCLEYLAMSKCDHIFLFHELTFPISADWHLGYIKSSEPYLNYVCPEKYQGIDHQHSHHLYQDEHLNVWSGNRYLLTYLNNSILETVGGFRIDLTELESHLEFSDRIFNNGMTSFRYMDHTTSDRFFLCKDHFKTVIAAPKVSKDDSNRYPKIHQYYSTADFVPYVAKHNTLITTYFTLVADPQRITEPWLTNITPVEPLIRSLKGVPLVVLHDSLTETITNCSVTLNRVNTSINPYFQRWISYLGYLLEHRLQLSNVFCIDATDIEVLNDPFKYPLSNFLWVGDENEKLGNDWLKSNHVMPRYSSFYEEFGDFQLLNAGIVGGEVEIVIRFIKDIVDVYHTLKIDSLRGCHLHDAGLTDMGVFNFVAYTRYLDKLKHGTQVNTRFKAEERSSFSWFKHK